MTCSRRAQAPRAVELGLLLALAGLVGCRARVSVLEPLREPIACVCGDPVAEVAGFLCLPAATLRSRVSGRDYPTAAGTRRFRPLICIAASGDFLVEPSGIAFRDAAQRRRQPSTGSDLWFVSVH